jgi:hypothetical protein
MSQPIAYCLALKNTDFKFPSTPYAISSFVHNCRELEIDILDLFPKTFILPNTQELNASNLFNTCLKLGLGKITLTEDGINNTYVINQDFYNSKKENVEIKAQMDVILLESQDKLGKLLWNNKNVKWKSHSGAFTGCSNLLRSYVPTSWGGTGDDLILIEKSDKEKIAELTLRLEVLEAYIQNNPEVTESTLEFE